MEHILQHTKPGGRTYIGSNQNNASLPVFPISMLNRLHGLFGFCRVLVDFRMNI
jgi:hypothetical protein